jgi:hypothetical protein
MKTITLNLIERSLTCLLATQTMQELTSADERGLISVQIAQAVAMLEKECEDMLAKARASSDHASGEAAATRRRNIISALTTFKDSQPYSLLSNNDKMIVLTIVRQQFETRLSVLRILDYPDPWSAYKRNAYDALIAFLGAGIKRLSGLQEEE